MRYITRPEAVRDGREGILLVGIGHGVGTIGDYALLRASLVAWAHSRQTVERLGASPGRRQRGRAHAAPREGRTHYRAVLGFERDVGTSEALSLTRAWLQSALPRACAVAAVHRDTSHLHVHLWIDARQTDGRKIGLSARAWRQLDESWNRLYCRALGLAEREHLVKKWATERAKQLRRAGRAVSLPERAEGQYRRPKGQDRREAPSRDERETPSRQGAEWER